LAASFLHSGGRVSVGLRRVFQKFDIRTKSQVRSAATLSRGFILLRVAGYGFPVAAVAWLFLPWLESYQDSCRSNRFGGIIVTLVPLRLTLLVIGSSAAAPAEALTSLLIDLCRSHLQARPLSEARSLAPACRGESPH